MSSPGSPEVAEPTDDPELRAARRTLILFAVAVVAAVIGLAVALTSGSDPSTLDAGDTSSPIDGSSSTVGPAPGTAVGGYAAERRAHLTDIEGRRTAVVSFREYLDTDAVDDLVDGLARVRAVLVALPGDEPRLGRSVEPLRRTALAEAESQLEEIGSLAPTVEDEEFAAFYRSELIRYRQVVASADRADIVFAVVVSGRAADLRALASRSVVRLVDVVEREVPLDASSVTGLRPEEVVTAGEPRFRP